MNDWNPRARTGGARNSELSGQTIGRVEGDIEDVDGVMKIARIRVHYNIKLPAGKREAAQRALDVHERGCPAAMSVNGCIAIEWTADFEEA